MRTIQITITNELTSVTKTVEVGTNERDGGIFIRTVSGSWSQMTGNSQTPCFKNAKQLMTYLRKNHYTNDGTEKIKMVRGSGF